MSQQKSKDIKPPESPARRRFFGQAGLGAVAATGSLSACIRKPVEHILPYASRPEDLIPGKPNYFATSTNVGDRVFGLLVESHGGRPTKVEGNPKHPLSRGRANAWAQAYVLGLYDKSRSAQALLGGAEVERSALNEALEALRAKVAERKGRGAAVLLSRVPSPTRARLLNELSAALPELRFFEHDLTATDHAERGAELAGAEALKVSVDLSNAATVVALDYDLLGREGDAVKNTRDFADGRRLQSADAPMNRLYAVEPGFSITGAAADHRLRLSGAKVGDFLALLAKELRVGAGVSPKAALPERAGRFAKAMAKDLLQNRGRSAVLVGDRQPAHVHALAYLVNQSLTNVGKTIRFRKPVASPATGDIRALASAALGGSLDTLFIVGANPVYDAPVELGFSVLMSRIANTVHLGLSVDETGSLASIHIPASHDLESWGDLEASEGTVSLRQPLLGALNDSNSGLELLGWLGSGRWQTGYDLVRSTWSSRLTKVAGTAGGTLDAATFEIAWRRWVHDGVVESTSGTGSVEPRFSTRGLAAAWKAAPSAEGLAIDFVLDPNLADGRFANNAWLQELPDPMTKLTWDNAAQISSKTAAALGVETGQMVRLELRGRMVTLPALVAKGTADDTVVMALGYGRTAAGDVGNGVGVSAALLQDPASPWIDAGATLTGLRESTPMALSQDHDSMEGRPIVRQATLKEWRATPDYVQAGEVMPAEKLKSLWEEPNKTDGQQWGLSIDLSSCTGCGACTIACQSENNIPVVGKSEVLNGREMAWIRIDRYFTGSDDEPEAVSQPVGCAHCETAPCENVCPVQATSHSPEGLNDMTYNRCIGTRYCANNCPYKVRRFNFFNYTARNDDLLGPMIAMQRNPDVSVRFRGVMEKCTYCVQRINQARIDVKGQGGAVIADGAVTTACEQTCPAGAITFGDINDEKSRVSVAKSDPRTYGMLSELNIRPRTTYLGKVKNPNPELS